MKPLRILLVTNKCPPDFDGGYELRAFQIANALRDRGHEVEIVTSKFRPTYTGERDDPEWVHRILRYVLVSRSRTLWRYVDRLPRRIACTSVAQENVPAMEAFLDGRSYDLAYCFGLHRVSLAIMEPVVRRGIPILWHAGDGYIADHLLHWPKTLPGYALSLQLFARRWYEIEKQLDFRHIAFVSEFLRDECMEKGFRPKRPFVISRGIDFPLGWDVERRRPDPPIFFMAGRIDPQKGMHHAIEAAAMLRRKRPELDWRLEIAGIAFSGYLDKLHAQIRGAGIEDRVSFLGQIPRKEVLTRMREATAFLSCSTYGEPFAGTIIESLASGTLLIGSNAGSIREVAKHEESALIYEQNRVDQLATHMERALSDPELRRRIALAGVRVIEQRYTLDAILQQTEAAFEEVIAAGPFKQ